MADQLVLRTRTFLVKLFEELGIDVTKVDELEDTELMQYVSSAMLSAGLSFTTYITTQEDG